MTKLAVDELHGVVTIAIDGPLAAANFRTISDRIEPEVHRAGGLRGLILHAEQFPGWRDLAEFLNNLRFLREGLGTLRRVAAVTDSAPADFLRPLSGHFDAVEVRHFRTAGLRRAERWVAELDAATADARADAQEPVEASALEADSMSAADALADDGSGVILLEDAEAEAGEDIDDWFVKN